MGLQDFFQNKIGKFGAEQGDLTEKERDNHVDGTETGRWRENAGLGGCRTGIFPL